jgi:ATP-binding cassette subfamily B protein
LLPVSNQAYSAWSNIQGAQASIQDVLELLDQPMPVDELLNDKPINFSDEIILNKIGFRYSLDAPFVFENIYLKFAKGSRVGIVGSTGAGKSTLIDIFMGLLMTTVGTLEVDGVAITQLNCRSWQSLVAHVPQAIFLADSTIEENIAFGVSKDQIDYGRVTKAAIQAQLHQVIAGWENGYKTIVGERGVRLSGGQRQRIGIARALYKNASIIVFDEATSALDAETEGAVMNAIDALDHDLTVLIIAHRVSTLKNCSSIIQLGNGKIEWTGNYIDYVEKIKTSN